MKRAIRPAFVLTVLACLGLSVAPAQAQETYTITLAALGGLGGSIDAKPGDDLTNQTLQLTAALITEPKTHLGVRLGRIELDDSDPIGSLTKANLTYVNVAGEYRFSHSFYESGIYLGLGAYRLEGNSLADGSDRSDSAFGGVLGLTGQFELSRHFVVLIDLAGHWANLDEEQIFATGLIGVGFRF